MRIVAIIANIIFTVVIFISFVSSAETTEVEGWFIFILILVAPILSIIALVINRRGGKSFIGLWFARKALEEKKKIEKQQSQKTSEQ